MSKNLLLRHAVQKHIIDSLTTVKFARYRDLRPAGVDSNLYTYHLNKLISICYVEKTESGYTLSAKGLAAIAQNDLCQYESSLVPCLVALVIQNAEGDVLLSRVDRQPFIDSWSLPMGASRTSDSSVLVSARRVYQERFAVDTPVIERAGSCFVRVLSDDEVIYSRQLQIFRTETELADLGDDLSWARPHKLGQYELFPSTEEMITRTFFRDEDYFEEYSVEL